MDIFVARQPILTQNEDVFGYELLYRDSTNNSFNNIDGDTATTDLLINSFLGIGNDTLAGGKKLFINFTKNLLLKKIPGYFSPDKIVIEVLEDVLVDDETITVLDEFQKAGYTIALDDFILRDNNKLLLPYADIIKVDFLNTTKIERKLIQKLAHDYNIELLAEKVETREDFQTAISEGFKYFQGFFFSKPVIVSSTDVPAYSYEYIEILNELNKDEPCIDKIALLIECDLSLSYKILKVVNTMAFYTRTKIHSIKQAIIILGLNELIKWLTIMSLKERLNTTNVPTEVIINSLVRAKLAEQFGEKLFGSGKKSECFMLGMFSLLDTILQRPMENILHSLPLNDAVKTALKGEESEYSIILKLIEAIEQADWKTLEEVAPVVSPLKIDSCYRKSIQWATEINSNIENVVSKKKNRVLICNA